MPCFDVPDLPVGLFWLLLGLLIVGVVCDRLERAAYARSMTRAIRDHEARGAGD